jgi:transcriptional regulator with XRE-family HTH domain
MTESTGQIVARLRLDAKLSQYELAERSGITRQALRNIEDGTSGPSLETARKLCEVLGVSLSVFDAPPV